MLEALRAKVKLVEDEVSFSGDPKADIGKKKRKPHSATMSRDTRNMIMLTGNPIWRAFAKRDPVSQKTQASIYWPREKRCTRLPMVMGDLSISKRSLSPAYAGIHLAEHGYGPDLTSEFHVALASILSSYEREN